METLYMPYHRLKKCGNILVAARGSSIDSFSLEDGSLLSTWNCPSSAQKTGHVKAFAQQVITKLAVDNSESTGFVPDGSPPQVKRRKLSDTRDGDDKTSAKGGSRKVNNRSDAVSTGLEAPAVIDIVVTEAGGHVVAVTGEDKTVRVFENVLVHDGLNIAEQTLCQISCRVMPKRPCAIAITDDDSTIICADKFGDVYSLPLLATDKARDRELTSREPPSTTNTLEPIPLKPFIPAANNLTVHSLRNRKALENQKRQTNKPPVKSEPDFDREILLGHVSMLTDVALVSLDGRSYIITADRDEHIRISRGIPQAHIVEGYCLGHTEFVSRICVPRERRNLLISGGGDDYLLVWNWESKILVSKVDLKSHVFTVMYEIFGGTESSGLAEVNIAVSGIYHKRQPTSEGFRDIVVVTSEGIPASFVFLLTTENHLEHLYTLKLPGNATAVLADTLGQIKSINTAGSLVVAIDTIHKPGSTTEYKDNFEEEVNPLQMCFFHNSEPVEYPVFEKVPQEVPGKGSGWMRGLTNLMYNLETLRKRTGED